MSNLPFVKYIGGVLFGMGMVFLLKKFSKVVVVVVVFIFYKVAFWRKYNYKFCYI